MPKIEIIKAGLMTSIQDLGRKGMAYFAIPKSGVMDVNSAQIALLLLNQAPSSPLIECTSMAPQIKFHGATRIAITGADFNWTINNEKVPRNWCLEIKPGDILKGQFTKDGLRGYIAIEGELLIESVYDSYSTYINAKLGGFKGRLLQKGDILEWKETKKRQEDIWAIPIKSGPEYDLLSDIGKTQLITHTFEVEADSNRMGLRLNGKPIEVIGKLENSVPVLPGFIQLPPSGLPIVVLQDGQTTGGYPRIAYLQEKHLAELNQIPLKGNLKFQLQ